MLESISKILDTGNNSVIVTVSLLAVVLMLVVICAVNTWRLRVIRRRLDAMMRGSNEVSLEQMLVDCMSKIDSTDRRIEAVEHAVGILQAKIPSCIQRVNMIRFDAFEDVGGQQSFSIALLDAVGDGVIITSVYSRMDIRVYAKAIRNGHASHPLSDEESRVLREAT